MNKQKQAKDASINWLSEQKRINALAYPQAPKAPKVPNIQVGKTPGQIEQEAGFDYNANARDARSFMMDFYDRMQRDSRSVAERAAIETDKQGYRQRQNTRLQNQNSQAITEGQLREQRRQTEMQGAYNMRMANNDSRRVSNDSTRNILDFQASRDALDNQYDIARLQARTNKRQTASNERIAAQDAATRRYTAQLEAQSRMFGSLTNNGGAGYSYWGGTI